jgi:hypothetical protein
MRNIGNNIYLTDLPFFYCNQRVHVTVTEMGTEGRFKPSRVLGWNCN